MRIPQIAAVVLALAIAAPGPRLPACTPAQVATWPIVNEKTQVEGRTIVTRQSPDGSRRCGVPRRSTVRPSQTAPKPVRGRR